MVCGGMARVWWDRAVMEERVWGKGDRQDTLFLPHGRQAYKRLTYGAEV